MLKRCVVMFVSLFISALSFAEQWPTENVYNRVFMLRAGTEEGSSFVIERNGRQYLVTARHIVQSLPVKKASIDVNLKGTWKTLTVDVLLPTNPDVDVAVLVLEESIADVIDVEVGCSIAFGQEGYFLGFPGGLHTIFNGQYMALMKRAALMGIDNSEREATIMYLDGMNNFGFSGGPVAFYDYRNSKWCMEAVISGFKPENATVKVGKTYQPAKILINSGIVLATPILSVTTLIDSASQSKLAN